MDLHHVDADIYRLAGYLGRGMASSGSVGRRRGIRTTERSARARSGTNDTLTRGKLAHTINDEDLLGKLGLGRASTFRCNLRQRSPEG